MRAILYCAFTMMVLNSNGMAEDKKQDKFEAERLVGKWMSTEQKGKHPVTLEFRKDGTFKATLTIKGENYLLSGKYRTDGNKVVIVLRDDKERDEVYTLRKLTETELVWIAEKDQATERHTRVKDK